MTAILAPSRLGCLCGCTTKLPWIDDPDCIRHRPIGPPIDYAALNGYTDEDAA